MGISSEDAKRVQFSGSEHAYDAAEVEDFRQAVVAALQAHEAELLDRQAAPDENLIAAQRARHQAVELAERMLRDVMGASGTEVSGLESWQEAAMLNALAEEELAFSQEEARRLTAVAEAEAANMRARYAQERRELRAELQHELQSSREASELEATSVKTAAIDEANAIVKLAVERADETHRSSVDESRRIERRLAVLHTALADAEARFRRLASTAANEVGTLAAIVDETGHSEDPPPARPELYLASIDLTDEGLAGDDSGDDQGLDEDVVETDPEAGFYQKRLAGLRDRLEKSGHPPA